MRYQWTVSWRWPTPQTPSRVLQVVPSLWCMLRIVEMWQSKMRRRWRSAMCFFSDLTFHLFELQCKYDDRMIQPHNTTKLERLCSHSQSPTDDSLIFGLRRLNTLSHGPPLGGWHFMEWLLIIQGDAVGRGMYFHQSVLLHICNTRKLILFLLSNFPRPLELCARPRIPCLRSFMTRHTATDSSQWQLWEASALWATLPSSARWLF
jgi:hypothetical protein